MFSRLLKPNRMWSPRDVVGGACVLVVLCATAGLDAQTLDELRSEVRDQSEVQAVSSRRDKRNDRRTSRSSIDDMYCVEGEFGSSLFKGLLQAPFAIPRALVRDRDFDLGFFPRYPYLHDSAGYVTELPDAERGTDPWLLRLRAEYFDDFDAMDYWGGSLLFDTSIRLGFDAEFYRRREALIGATDSLYTGDANVVFRFAQSPTTQMRAGVGLNWLDDKTDIDFGFNLTYSGDWFPADPWIMSGEIDYGTLGDSRLLHLRATVGAQFHRVELFTGYDYFSAGRVDIHGPVFGLRFWL